jgi:hypothetical protein
MYGGEGNDRITHAHCGDCGYPPEDKTDPDGKRDIIDCGPGNDIVWINTVDCDMAVNCETIYDERIAESDGGPESQDVNQAPDVSQGEDTSQPPDTSQGEDVLDGDDDKKDDSAKNDAGTESQGEDVLDGDDKSLSEK